MYKSDEEKFKILNEFLEKLVNGMEELNPFCNQVISEKFWELIKKDKEIENKTDNNSSS